MAKISESEFGDKLEGVVSKWDRSAIYRAIERYFTVQQELREARAQRTTDQRKWNARKADYGDKLIALRKALRRAIRSFEKNKDARKFSRAHALAIYHKKGKSTAINRVHAAVKGLADDVREVLTEFRLLIAPGKRFRPLVKSEVIARFAPFAALMAGAVGAANKDRLQLTQEALAAELRRSFESEMKKGSSYARPEAERLSGQKQQVSALEARARAARGKVLDAGAKLLGALRDILRNNQIDASPSRVREMLRIRVIQRVRVAPWEVRGEMDLPDEDTPAERGLETDVQKLVNNLEVQWRKDIESALSGKTTRPAPKSLPRKKKAHRCGAACFTQDGTCRRRTTEKGYCYQHEDEVPDAAVQALAGRWVLSGKQSGLERSGWQAELLLNKNGKAKWKEVKGANPGARRKGRWNLREGVFLLRYRAPRAGMVKWTARNVKPEARSMSGEYRTPQVRPQGFGGTFSGKKTRV